MLRLYRLLTLPALPFVFLWLMVRALRGREEWQRLPQRLGFGYPVRPAGTLVWLHAASVGESLSLLPLLAALHSHKPDAQMLVTTGTVTSARLMAERLPAYAHHAFVPVDCMPCVAGFLRHWKPSLAVMAESELWPNLITLTAQSACPVILANARLSERSFRRWQMSGALAKPLFSTIHTAYAQSDADAERLRALGIIYAENCGNLKADAQELPCDMAAFDALQHHVAGRTVWLAASTHPGEEGMVAEVHQAVKARFANLLTVIAPRHAVRGNAVRAELEAAGLRVAQRSRGEMPQEQTDIFLADTMGELGLLYRLCRIVFLGGSLVPHGGQNLLEPARLNCAILSGPHLFNFEEIARGMCAADAFISVTDAAGLGEKLAWLFENGQEQAAYAVRARTYAASLPSVSGKLAEKLASFL